MISLKTAGLIIIGCLSAAIILSIIELIYNSAKKNEKKEEPNDNSSSLSRLPEFKPIDRVDFHRDGRRGITKRGGITGDPDDDG